MIWFFIGDVVEWLQGGRKISGVQRVSLELLFASHAIAESNRRIRIGLCAFDQHGTDLVAVDVNDALRLFAHYGVGMRASTGAAAARRESRRSGWLRTLLQFGSGDSIRDDAPAALLPSTPAVFGSGDHLLFLGLVWSERFPALFRELAVKGTKFSVLTHDMIQVQRPDLVGEAMCVGFQAWLDVAARTATNMFVPSAITKEALAAWGIMRGIDVRPRITLLRFGMSHLASIAGVMPSGKIRADDYVLSVGTIDQRKNQAMLCAIWADLIGAMGPAAVPQLVLAGRNDLLAWDGRTLDLISQEHILILENANDSEVAALYRNCRFSLFPSLAEGFGLPVAESLSFGKLCIASDLPEVAEFARDFVWYFPSGCQEGAMIQIRRAIESPDQLMAQEVTIRRDFVPPTWRDAALSMLGVLA